MMQNSPNRRDVYRVGCEIVADSMRSGREVRILVTGGSMLPSLWPGDIIVARGLDDAPPAPGEVLLFLREGWLCAHRMVRWLDNESALITCGDSANASDPPTPTSKILGRAVAIIRDGRELDPLHEPSRAQAIVSSAVRRSELLKRVVLKIHAMRHRSIAGAETECRSL